MSTPEEKKPTNGIVRLLIAVIIVFAIGVLIPPVRQAMLKLLAEEEESIKALRERIHQEVEKALAAKPLPGMQPAANVTIVSSGLTNAQLRTDWHRTPEGSDVFPVALFRALNDPETGRPIIESFAEFGMIPSPDDDSGLPVGFSRIMVKDHKFVMTGFNCAGCHSSQIDYQGRTLFVDGAPGMIDVEKFFRRTLAALEAVLDLKHVEEGIKFLARFVEYNAIEREKLHLAGEQELEEATGSVATSHEEAHAFLKMKLATLVRIIASFDNQTAAGPGRADSFGLIRNMLMVPGVVGGNNFMPMTAPVSIPHLFGFGSYTNLHWDGNTTTGNDRNYAQAIALGANFDPKPLISSVRPYELYKLEETARHLVAPPWPEEVLGRLDAAKVKRGKQVYKSAGCAGCHTTPGWHQLKTIGTDPNRLVNYNTPLNVGDGKQATYATNLYTSAIAVKEKAYEQHQVPPAEQKKMDTWHEGVTPVWITTLDKGYHTRPLRGVWATAPFLHNNSVPSLWHLLQPADQRPKSFAVGHREFDPRQVGYVAEPAEVVWNFDTTISGNHNTGHEFGVKLPDEDKWALIEFLKTL